MADLSKSRSPHSQSFIPVVAPRPIRSTLPSSLSLPQLNLGPTSRRPSADSSSAALIPVASSPNILTTSGSAVSPFRSLRNLLPFGGGKQQAPSIQPNGISNNPRSSFSNFGSVRRSMTGERKSSISAPQVEVPEPSPVISIGSSPQHTDTETDHDTLPCDSGSSSGDLQQSNHRIGENINGQMQPPGSLSHPGDLSTIIEAETSGMSKHLPNLEDSRDIRLPAEAPSTGPVRRNEQSLLHTSLSYTKLSGVKPPADPRDTSALDWSTAELTAEVISAMKAKDVSNPRDWIMGVDGLVVDDDSGPVVPQLELLQTPETEKSFNFGALDPDLAALLSPNRVDVNDQTIFGLKPSSPIKRSPPPSPGTYHTSPSRSHTPRTPPSTTSPGSPTSLHQDGFFPPAVMGGHSTPAERRSAKVSKRAAFNRPASLSGLPRLTRSVTSTPFRQGRDADSGSPSPQTSPELEDFNIHTLEYSRRRQLPSPLSASSQVGRINQSQRHDSLGHSQRLSQSRLVTPARRTASYSIASTRSVLRTNSDVRDRQSITTPENVFSSADATSNSRKRLQYPKPSVDESRSNGDVHRTFHHHRTRKRSTSLIQDAGGSLDSMSPYQIFAPPSRPSSAMSTRRPTAEWLGPRTAKAFAAAGLLDHDKTFTMDAPPHRGAPSRGTSEFDTRQYSAPSRMAFSESGSAASWGRSRSASRTLTMSDTGGALTESPTLSTTPRTTFSGHSTAPTSISASSSMTQSTMQTTIQSMKEKHSQETEALLSALSDSQRTTKILREENTELRIRIDELEMKINQLKRRSASPQPPSRSLSRIVYDRMGHPPIESGLHRRSYSTTQAPSSRFLHPNSDIPIPPPLKEGESTSTRRRLSTASSIFRLPPSNMSMLLNEGDIGVDAGTFSSRSDSPGPPSPTVVVPRRSSPRHSYNPSKSMSDSGGNISPTTVDFSITGSPSSLHLRPEHELHLGDMASIDLALVGEDSGDDDRL